MAYNTQQLAITVIIPQCGMLRSCLVQVVNGDQAQEPLEHCMAGGLAAKPPAASNALPVAQGLRASWPH
jgi:hypothetical protein